MREILFRGKRLGDVEWVYGSLHIEYGETTKDGNRAIDYRILGMRGECYYVNPSTVGQYTGLEDKNGKRVFEGDVIKCEDSSQAVYGIVKYGQFKSYTVEQIGVYIEWQNENANRWCDWLRQDILFWIKRGDCEIVSNIHDNPEPLEGDD